MTMSISDETVIPERRCRSVFFGSAGEFLPSSLSCTKIERDFRTPHGAVQDPYGCSIYRYRF